MITNNFLASPDDWMAFSTPKNETVDSPSSVAALGYAPYKKGYQPLLMNGRLYDSDDKDESHL
jgi:hypothetical protein